MANRLHYLRRAACAAGAILLGSAGCAFPHGSTGGDPLLGNFNRPIVPTPPPERGGLGLDSPAYDAGSRIGVSSPDVPTAVENSSGFQSLPSLTAPNLLSGARMPFQSDGDAAFARKTLPGSGSGIGAKLPSAEPAARGPVLPGAYTARTADGVTARPRDPVANVTSASSFAPADLPSPILQVGHVLPRDPARLSSVEDASESIRMAGAQGQRMEQLANGEWLFACTANAKVYEARGKEPLEAMRKVLQQIQK